MFFKTLFADRKVGFTIIVAALGYFVDVFDLGLFSAVRTNSLKSLGLQGDELLNAGVFLLNWQNAGLLLGGILWGILGDKKGRLSVLLGSIFLYSIANIANAYVTSVEEYAAWRFIAGIGLAGELGAGITLASELLPRQYRGYGTTLIASFGVLGGVASGFVGHYMQWNHAFLLGGVMGLALLALRIGLTESTMFQKMDPTVVKGAFLRALAKPHILKRLFLLILVGAPVWLCVGLFITFAPELGTAMGLAAPPSAAIAYICASAAIACGDLLSGLYSQHLQSRKKVARTFIIAFALAIMVYAFIGSASTVVFYGCYVLMGLACGYWTIFAQMGAENFGTNIRSTLATSIPNFVRATIIPVTLLFQFIKLHSSVLESALIVSALVIALALWALSKLPETFHQDLEYVEKL
ncbi:MAG: MFS transporter [Dongiaceae bacterium]